MILYFMRHGSADPYGSKPDEERQLTEGGRAALRAAAPHWKRLGVRPDIVLSSPRQRAMDTAQLFVAGTGSPKAPAADGHLAPGARWPDLSSAIAAHRDADSVMLVGHEPDLSESLKELTGASVRLREGGLCRVEFRAFPEPGTGVITLLLDPDLYVGD